MLIKSILLFLVLFNQSYAEDILYRIAARLEQALITQGEFQQEKNFKFLSKPLLSTGTFTYHKSQGVIWKTLSPLSSTLLVNDTQLSSEQGERVLPPAFGRVFKALLGGELKRLDEAFIVTGKDLASGWQVQLTPKDDLLKKIISAIMLTGDSELRLLELQEVNGNATRIQFAKISHPKQLSAAQQSDFESLSP